MLAIPLFGNYPVPPFGAILVLLWVQWSRTPWGDIGYVRPKSWTRDLAVGIAFGVAFKLLMKALVMPLLGAPPINQAYQYLTGNRAALPGAVYLLIAGGGFGEETVYRGFLFERFGKLSGSGASAKRGIVLLTAAWSEQSSRSPAASGSRCLRTLRSTSLRSRSSTGISNPKWPT